MNNGFNNNGQNQNFNQQANQGFQQQGFQQGYPQQNFNPMQQQQNFGGQAPQDFNQQQPVAPHSIQGSNVIQGSFTMAAAGIPTSGGSNFSANKNPNVQEVPSGPQMGRIYSIVDLGSQMNNFKGNVSYKRTVKISIEFPQYLQQFYLDRPDLKPTSIMQDYTMSTADGAHLTKLIKAAEGRALSQAELATYDYANLLGKVLLFTVEHKQSTKDPSKVFVNIENVSGLGSFPLLPEFNNPQVPRNPVTLFYLGEGCINLQTEYFANLPLFLRRKIVESQEVIDYLAKGGQIFRNDNNAKDNFYGTQNPPANGNSGFSQPTNQPNNFLQQHNANQNPPMGNPSNAQGFGQQQQFNQQPQQGFHQQYAEQNQGFGQQAPMQQQGFGQAPQQDFNHQAQQQQFNQPVQQQQQFGGQPQQNFNQGQQFQQQQQAPQHPFGQQANQNDFGQGQVSNQMQQATQMMQQQFGGQPQVEQFNQQQEQPQNNGGFSMGANDDDLPF